MYVPPHDHTQELEEERFKSFMRREEANLEKVNETARRKKVMRVADHYHSRRAAAQRCGLLVAC